MLASKFGADSNLLASPLKTKLGCWPLVLVPAVLEVELVLLEEGRNNIHGTATCLPVPLKVDDVLPGVVVAVELELELLLLAPAVPAPLKEITANSRRPEAGLIIVSLIVPISLPDDPVICAPVS